jgi:dTDP-4-amino-4,6-dideoxygalactose transaminase
MKLTVGGQEMFPSYPREDWWYHREALDAAIQRVLTGGNYVLGDEVQAFERSFAASVGVSHAIGVANGTDAIELILRALCIGSGDRVAVPSFTAGAVAAAVTRAGAEVVLVDIEPASFTMCPRSLEAVLRSSVGAKVKAAVVVHLFGHPAQWEELKRVADAYDVELIEDGAQAHGAVYQGQCIGSLARASAFSF